LLKIDFKEDDMSNKNDIVEKEVNKLQIGDILGEDIAGSDDLKRGVSLTKERLSIILKKGIKQVKVMASADMTVISKKEVS